MSMTGTRPTLRRDVVCVIDDLHRDRAVADAVLDGRFHHCGVELWLGNRPDWIAGGLDDDEEWRIEWVKGYEGLDLGHAYAETGDARYMAAWCALVDSFAEQVPVGHDSSDVSARRVQNWIYAAQRFGSVALAEHDPDFERRLGDRIALDVAHLADHLTPERNHRTLELYALLIAGVAFPDVVDPSGRVIRAALDGLEHNARTDLWVDGTHRECSTDYHHIVLRSLLGTIANCREFRLPLSAGFSARVELAADWAMHVQRPDGTIPSFSDGDNGDHRSVLRLAARLFHRADFEWVASAGTAGRPPAVAARTFPVGGYVVQRSGWGTARAYGDERFALFDCGPLGDGGHGHYDQLHVELVDGHHPLAVDPGRYTYADTPWRHRFKGTAAHNTVTVDGLDQTPYRRGKPKGPVSVATLLERRAGDDLDVVIAQVVSPAYDAVHTRRIAFCAGEYWIVHDQLRSPSAHRYELRWHLAPEMTDRITLRPSPDHTMVATPWARFAIGGAGEVRIEDGWVSPTYGVKHQAPVVVAERSGTDVDLVTVVTPGAAARVRISECDAGGVAVVVGHGSGTDAFEWAWGSEPRWVRR